MFVVHQLNDDDNPSYVEIANLLANVSEPETSASFQRMKSIGDLILPELDQYYTYHGSLTTPPCSEVVTWIDFKQSIPLSHAQVICKLYNIDSQKKKRSKQQQPAAPRSESQNYFISVSYDLPSWVNCSLVATHTHTHNQYYRLHVQNY